MDHAPRKVIYAIRKQKLPNIKCRTIIYCSRLFSFDSFHAQDIKCLSMRKQVHCLFLLLFYAFAGNAQISGPAIAPAGAPVTFSSTISGHTYNWSVGGAPVNVDPVSYTPAATNVAGAGTLPNQVKMVVDGTNWYSFTILATSGTITRASYGADPRSVPTTTPLTPQVTTITSNQTKAIDVVYDSTNARWYIFVAHGGQNTFYKLTMGATGLTDLNPTIEKIPLVDGSGGAVGFDVTDQLTIKKYNGEWLAFIGGGGQFARLDLGTSLAALTPSTNLVKHVLGNGIAKYFSLYQENGEWFAFSSNGVIAAINFRRIEFGTDLKNNSPAAVSVTVPGSPSYVRSVLVVAGCDNEVFGYVMGSAPTIHMLDFNGSIKNTPSATTRSVSGLGFTADGVAGVSPFVYRDTLYAAMSEWKGNRLYTLRLLPLTGSQTKYYDASYQHTFAAPGTYTVNLFVNQGDQSGPSAYCHTITVNTSTTGPARPDPYTAAPSPVCQGQQTVTYTVPSVTNAVAYHWHYTGSGATYTASTTAPSNVVSFNSSATGGALRVWAVDNNGDSSFSPRDTVITVNVLPNVSINPATVSICAGESVTLAASGATTYSWSPSGGSNASATVSPSATTTYTVTGTSLGCSDTAIRQVIVNNRPVVDIAPATAEICAGDSVTLTASGADTYIWMPSVGNTATVKVFPGSTTTYTVEGTHTATGCKNTATRQVMVNPLPVTRITAAGGITDICSGDSAVLIASGSGYDYEWKNGGIITATGNRYAVYATGSYKVIATDQVSGCSDSTQAIDIRVHTRPVVSLEHNDTSFCDGGRIIFEVSTPDTGLTYVWKRDDHTVSLATAYFLEISESGSYKVIVGRAGIASCEDSTNEVSVTVHDLPVVVITWDGEALHAPSGYVSYQWHTVDRGIDGATDSTYKPSSGGSYRVAVTDTNGCVGVSPFTDLPRVNEVDMLSYTGIRVYPNPSEGMVYIASPAPVDVLLFGSDGRILQRVQDARYINLGDYAAGLYLLRITDTQGRPVRNEWIKKQ